MAKKKEYRIDFVIDGKKATATIQGLDSAVKHLSRNTRSAAERLSQLGNIVTGFRSAVSIISQLQGVVMRAVDAWKIQEQAEKSLATALHRNADELIRYAGALQSVTTHGDEEIIRAEALIAAYVKDEKQIKQLTKATLDFADAKGINLKNAAELVAKTIGSSTNALSRYGIEVHGAANSTERLEMLLGGIEEKFGGQAVAKAATETGKYTQQMNLLGDQMERIGKIAAPIIGSIAEGLANLTKLSLDFLLPTKTNMEKATEAAAEQKAEFERLVGTYERLRLKVNRTNIEQEEYKKTITALQRQYPQYLKNVDLERDSYEKVEKAIAGAREKLEEYLKYQIQMGVQKDKRQKIIDAEVEAYKQEEELTEKKKKITELNAKIDEARKNKNYTQAMLLQNEKQSLYTEISLGEERLKTLREKISADEKKLLELQKRISEKFGDFIADVGVNIGDENKGEDAAAKAKKFVEEVNLQIRGIGLSVNIPATLDYQPVAAQFRELQEMKIAMMEETAARERAFLDMQYREDLERYKDVVGAKEVIDEYYEAKRREINERLKKMEEERAKSQVVLALNSLSFIGSAVNQYTAVGKGIAVAHATWNTYQAATKAYAELPPPINFVMAAAVTAAGLAQVQKIISTEAPKYAQGGIISGSLHSSGGVIVEAEGGEFIVNRRATSENRELLEAINAGRNISLPENSEGTRMIVAKLDEVAERLEKVERVVSVSQIDEYLTRYQDEKRMIGLE